MLISFSVENFRSFKNEVTLSLAANNGEELRNSHVYTPELKNGVKPIDLLRSAVIYGPNAGGKSNLFRAISTMETIVRASHKDNESLDIILPFLLSDKTNNAPSTFEVVILIDGIRYQYGFSATREIIHDEWLFAFPQGKLQKWFERNYDEKTKTYEYIPGNALKGRKKAWEELTDSKALFLSTAANYKGDQLKPIYDWFVKKMQFIGSNSLPPHFSMEYCKEHGSKEIINFLKTADFAIKDIEVSEKEFSPSHLPKNMPEPLANVITNEMKGKKQFDAETVHKTEEGNLVNFHLSMESDGTQNMFALALPFLNVLRAGDILIVDELNQRLHPYLMRYLVELFNNPKTNPNNAQLIFTTHAVSLLKQDIFRRDQIWFCEREENQATVLFPLTDFKPRKGHENFEGYYMGGRYGALPLIGDFSEIIIKDKKK